MDAGEHSHVDIPCNYVISLALKLFCPDMPVWQIERKSSNPARNMSVTGGPQNGHIGYLRS